MLKRMSLFSVCLFLSIVLGSCKEIQGNSKETSKNLLALYNCTVIDGTGNQPVYDRIILIKDDKIEKIIAGKGEDISKEYKKIDLKGCFVLPGFINSHVHSAYDENKLSNWLNEGVTTVRDLAARDSINFVAAKDELNQDTKNARLVAATPIIARPGGYGFFHIQSPQDAKVKINNFIDMKADIIKIAIEDDLQGRKWNMMSLEEIKSIVDTAHSRNKKVAAHISHLRNLPLALEAGVDELSHMIVEPLNENQVEAVIKKNIYWVPTLELWHGVSNMHGLAWDKIAMNNLEKFYKMGGKIALGTDFAGYMTEFDKGFPVTEINLMKEAGMSNMDIIVSATRNAAYVCDMEKELGTLEAGKIADILIVGSDPISNIKALTDRKMIIHNGRIIVDTEGYSK